jgi:hypothetical protein
MKIKLITVTAVLGLFGVYGLFTGSAAVQFTYTAMTAVFFLATALGGVLNYLSQENVDFRDMYREKDQQKTSRIAAQAAELKELRQKLETRSA